MDNASKHCPSFFLFRRLFRFRTGLFLVRLCRRWFHVPGIHHRSLLPLLHFLDLLVRDLWDLEVLGDRHAALGHNVIDHLLFPVFFDLLSDVLLHRNLARRRIFGVLVGCRDQNMANVIGLAGIAARILAVRFLFELDNVVAEIALDHIRSDLKQVIGQDGVKSDLSDTRARLAAFEEIKLFVRDQKYSAEDKDVVATSLAKQLNVDYEEVLEKRILHLLNPDEVKQLAADGVDVQLHTHRHRTPLDRELFLREIEDNRMRIEAMTGQLPSHFCYPSGHYHPLFSRWLQEAGIKTATTCEAGLASLESDPLLLPRLLDGSGRSSVEFAGWLSGVSAMLPNGHRAANPAATQPNFEKY